MACEIGKISYDELKRRAANGQLSADELAAYFRPDEKNSTAFVPAVKLNETLVDTGGTRPRSATLTKLLLEVEGRAGEKATATPLELAPRTALRRASARRISVLAEGDSWFRLPDFFLLRYPKDCVDILSETHQVKPVAFWGDEIARMVNATNRRNYLVPLNSGLYRHFIFSGGGNDVLGSIKTYVRRKGSAGTNPADPASYVHPDFNAKIEETIGHYETLYGHVRSSHVPDTPLYVHGYAYAIPKPNGPYLGRDLRSLGFDPALPFAGEIVRALVDRFNVALKAFADRRPTVHYVDMRAELGSSDWHTDEIHPSESGAKKVARKFREAIAATIPTV